MNDLLRGTQVIYVPTHAGGDMRHADCEIGFVTSDAGDRGVFCRYWQRGKLPGRVGVDEALRTKSCSELTPRDLLHVQDTIEQRFVVEALEQYC